MKYPKKILLFVIVSIFSSCGFEDDEETSAKYIETLPCSLCTIESVRHSKYTKVEGFIIYKNQKVKITNGAYGYYHKVYCLEKGHQVPLRDVEIYKVILHQEGKEQEVYRVLKKYKFSEYIVPSR